MEKFKNIMLFNLIFISIILIGLCLFYRINIMAVSNDNKIIDISIKSTNINEVTNQLYEKNLIKNRKVFKIYLDIYKINKFRKGNYKLSKSMNVEEIVNILLSEKEE